MNSAKIKAEYIMSTSLSTPETSASITSGITNSTSDRQKHNTTKNLLWRVLYDYKLPHTLATHIADL